MTPVDVGFCVNSTSSSANCALIWALGVYNIGVEERRRFRRHRSHGTWIDLRNNDSYEFHDIFLSWKRHFLFVIAFWYMEWGIAGFGNGGRVGASQPKMLTLQTSLLFRI